MPTEQKISSLRKSKGISQEMLAEECHVSLRTIQRIERGVTNPRPYTLKVIANALGVPVEVLNATDPRASAVQPDNEEATKLRLMNLSALAIMIFPLTNIVLPLYVWKKSKKSRLVNEVGRRIISFQILWTITTLVVLICAQSVLMGMKLNAIGRLPPTILLVYLMLTLLNCIFIVRASVSLHRMDHRVYSFVPPLF